MNAATSTLLYEFRIGGTFDAPDVKAVPAPVLSDAGALLFGRMATREQGARDADGRLLRDVGGRGRDERRRGNPNDEIGITKE
jgi:hypothetical protein